jgi:hypothetical protein
MMALLTIIGDKLARFGLAQRDTEAEVELTDSEQARRLIDDPLLWSLWMPGVQDLLEEPRAVRQNARYRVTMRMRAGRMGLSGGNREAHIQIVSAGAGRLAWQLLPGKHVEHYSVEVVGDLVRATATGGESALVVAHELERQSRP